MNKNQVSLKNSQTSYKFVHDYETLLSLSSTTT